MQRTIRVYDKANYADAIRNFDKAAECFKKSGNSIKLMEALSAEGISLDSLGKYDGDIL